MARARMFVLCGMVSCFAACPKRPAPGSPRIDCFEVTAAENSPGTRALFEKRQCQGGGVTWSTLLHVIVARQGHVALVEQPLPGWTGGVYTLNGQLRFSVDDEGDAARFCSDQRALLTNVHTAVARLNADAGELGRAMGEAKAFELECLEADGTPPLLPAPLPLPVPSPEELATTRAALARLKQALTREPVWCFPSDDYARRTGALRFEPDGSVTWIATTGETVGRGHWQLPRDELGDHRIEVDLQRLPDAKGPGGGALEHFDLGPTGRIGFDLIGEDKITRSEMVPGDGCLESSAKR